MKTYHYSGIIQRSIPGIQYSIDQEVDGFLDLDDTPVSSDYSAVKNAILKDTLGEFEGMATIILRSFTLL